MRLLTRKDQRALDQYLIKQGIPLLLLAENAGLALAKVIDKAAGQRQEPVDLFVGLGFNGADLYVAARHLYAGGLDVRIWEMESAQPLTGDLQVLRAAALASAVPCGKISDYKVRSAVLVDGIFGAGFDGNRPLPDQAQKALTLMKQAKEQGAYVVACDLPSGIDAVDGQVSAFTVPADETVTFLAPKVGQMESPACQYNGKLTIADLGISPALIEAFWQEEDLQTSPAEKGASFSGQGKIFMLEKADFQAFASEKDQATHKGKQGHVLIAAGSPGMAGACRLAAEACLRSGAGLISVITSPQVYPEVFQALPSLLYHIPQDDRPESWSEVLLPLREKVKAVLVGPGLGLSLKTDRILEEVSGWEQTLILDADAITRLAANPHLLDLVRQRQDQGKQTILTPHPGEAKRLAAALFTAEEMAAWSKAQRRIQAGLLSEKLGGACLVLKGQATVIAGAFGEYVNPTGGPALAKGGTGDILAGLMLGLCGQEPGEEGRGPALAAYWHGLAADDLSCRQHWRTVPPPETLQNLGKVLYLYAENSENRPCECAEL